MKFSITIGITPIIVDQILFESCFCKVKRKVFLKSFLKLSISIKLIILFYVNFRTK